MTETNKEVVRENGMSLLLVVITAMLGVGKLLGWWSITWLWVFSPLWIPFAFTLGFMVLIFAFCLAVAFAVVGGLAIGVGIEFVKKWNSPDLAEEEAKNE